MTVWLSKSNSAVEQTLVPLSKIEQWRSFWWRNIVFELLLFLLTDISIRGSQKSFEYVGICNSQGQMQTQCEQIAFVAIRSYRTRKKEVKNSLSQTQTPCITQGKIQTIPFKSPHSAAVIRDLALASEKGCPVWKNTSFSYKVFKYTFSHTWTLCGGMCAAHILNMCFQNTLWYFYHMGPIPTTTVNGSVYITCAGVVWICRW